MKVPAPENRDPETGLLSSAGLDRALDAELARATRHELPLSLVLLEISAHTRLADEQVRSIARSVAAAVQERIRSEDSAARLGQLKFAVLAVQTAESDTLAAALAEHVRSALLGPGEDAELSIAVGAVDCQYDEVSRHELMFQARRALGTAAVTGGDVAFPSPRRSSPASINGPDGVS
jgi:diguanylate cyclase (GGDEF)-like protein